MNDYIHPSVDKHPANNTSDLPKDSPPDGTQKGLEVLKKEMIRNYVSPGLRGASSIDRMESYGIDLAVPRRKE